MVQVKVCVGSSCHIRGGSKTLRAIKAIIEERDLARQVSLSADLCLEGCLQAPNVVVDGQVFGGVTPDKAGAFFEEQVISRLEAESGTSNYQHK